MSSTATIKVPPRVSPSSRVAWQVSYSMSGWCGDAVLEHVPCDGALFPTASLLSAHQLLQPWQGVASALYLECRLGGAPPAPLDLLVAVASWNREHLGRALEPRGDLDPVASFCAAWRQPDSPVGRQVSAIWLEMDDVVSWSAGRPPSLSACLIAGYG